MTNTTITNVMTHEELAELRKESSDLCRIINRELAISKAVCDRYVLFKTVTLKKDNDLIKAVTTESVDPLTEKELTALRSTLIADAQENGWEIHYEEITISKYFIFYKVSKASGQEGNEYTLDRTTGIVQREGGCFIISHTA